MKPPESAVVTEEVLDWWDPHACAGPYCSRRAVYWPGVCSLLCWAASGGLPVGKNIAHAYDLYADAEGKR